MRSTLFISYLLLVTISTAFMTVFSSLFTANAMTQVAIKGLRDLTAKVVDALDGELFKMNAVSVAVASSDTIKQLIKDRLTIASRDSGSETRLRTYRNTVQISSALQTIIGPYKPVPQVKVYTLAGEMIGAGVFSQASSVAVASVPWLSNIDLRSGTKKYSLPHVDSLLGSTFPQYRDRSYISLYRTFYDEFRSPVGIIEVEQFADTIFRAMSSETSRVVVSDSEGRQLFPVAGGREVLVPQALRAAKDGQIFSFREPKTGRTEIVMAVASQQSGWRIAVSQEQGLLLRPVRSFAGIILLFGLLLLAASIVIASSLSTRLTVPLRWIHDALRGLDWHTVSRETSSRPHARLDELEELQLAFQNMQRKLRESMDTALEARAHEMQATLLALQSQMDPHFVYNMMTTIGIMAEEGMTAEIAESVGNMTHLLRYISSGKASIVPLEQELDYAARYIACMAMRFRGSLSSDIDVPPELMRINVPKLIIQPIIENAMKYGLSARPPWHVSIRGESSESRWSISVRDNGPGFLPERLRELRETVETRMRAAPDPALSISGMGLLNISTRLRIFYGDEAIYRLDNDPAGGALVVIGGSHEPKTGIFNPGR